MEGIRRGYNVLTFEGPGQGEVIRVQHIPFRADWENVITPVVDYAVSRPDVDKDRIALWGISLGGYLAPRGAAYEHRFAALIADAGMYVFSASLLSGIRQSGESSANLTRDDLKAYLPTDPAEFNRGIRAAMEKSTNGRWLNENGMFVLNAKSPAQFRVQYMDFSLEGKAGQIRCPALVTAGSADNFDPGIVRAKMLYDHLTCNRKLLIFTDEFGAESHCQIGAFAQSYAAKFDWLDEKLGMGK
ncbi:MAG: Alpha/beta hydrolase family protein [Methanoregula sp. PtaU1.Bin051]|nr:MAG: Alpha/beta hydrolase family protein [Methanoregula sp. PtaU1.Bin051]